MRARFALFAILLVPVLAGFDCGGSGAGSGTRLSACIRLGEAYCNQEKQVGCSDPSSPCVSQDCYDFFDKKCLATAEDLDKVEHDINNIIKSKTTCVALRGVDDYLVDTVWTMADRECANSSAYPTLGEMCDELIDAYCSKIVALGCAPVTKDQCESLSWASGEASVDGIYRCTSPDDGTPPDSLQIAAQKQALVEIESATTCD